MPAPARVDDLAARKRALVTQAELHRQIIEIERFRLRHRAALTRERFMANRWWLLGGVVVAGWLSKRKLGTLLKLATSGMAAWRMLQGLRPR